MLPTGEESAVICREGVAERRVANVGVGENRVAGARRRKITGDAARSISSKLRVLNVGANHSPFQTNSDTTTPGTVIVVDSHVGDADSFDDAGRGKRTDDSCILVV